MRDPPGSALLTPVKIDAAAGQQLFEQRPELRPSWEAAVEERVAVARQGSPLGALLHLRECLPVVRIGLVRQRPPAIPLFGRPPAPAAEPGSHIGVI